jgi:hypothetical protein
VFSGLLESFFFSHLTTVAIIIAIIIVLTDLILVEELVDFAFTDAVSHFMFFFLMYSVGELSKISLLIRVWISRLVRLFIAAQNLPSISLLHFGWGGELQYRVMVHNLPILRDIVPELIIQGKHDS